MAAKYNERREQQNKSSNCNSMPALSRGDPQSSSYQVSEAERNSPAPYGGNQPEQQAQFQPAPQYQQPVQQYQQPVPQYQQSAPHYQQPSPQDLEPAASTKSARNVGVFEMPTEFNDEPQNTPTNRKSSPVPSHVDSGYTSFPKNSETSPALSGTNQPEQHYYAERGSQQTQFQEAAPQYHPAHQYQQPVAGGWQQPQYQQGTPQYQQISSVGTPQPQYQQPVAGGWQQPQYQQNAPQYPQGASPYEQTTPSGAQQAQNQLNTPPALYQQQQQRGGPGFDLKKLMKSVRLPPILAAVRCFILIS